MTGEDILNERKKRGMSQEEFGELLGVSRKTIMNYELGGNIPYTKVKVFQKILYNLGVNKKDLYLEKGKIKISSNEIIEWVILNEKWLTEHSEFFKLWIENKANRLIINKFENNNNVLD